ncbi:MAG: hypothetical protein IBX45_07035 [Campylobacterales bacterium]|nr:hypothetical protein [Campylobacterales bacterium]
MALDNFATLSSPNFKTPSTGVAAGQALVVYEEDRVLGGGWLE